MTEFQITNPEPFILGSGQQKYPGGYIGKVLLNGQTVFETLDATPKMCQISCVWWCIIHPPEVQPAQIDSVSSSSSSATI